LTLPATTMTRRAEDTARPVPLGQHGTAVT
jgi:hypothetical protein